MSPHKQNLCVAIVEDDPYISDLLTIRLRMAGYESFVVADGLEAPQVISERLPDGIFLDLGLPGQDGFEVIRCLNLNAQTAVIPVMIITARSENEDRARAEACGVEHFLVKPFNDLELLARTAIMLSEERPRSLRGPITFL